MIGSEELGLRDILAFLAGYEVNEAKLSISRLDKAEWTVPLAFSFWKRKNKYLYQMKIVYLLWSTDVVNIPLPLTPLMEDEDNVSIGTIEVYLIKEMNRRTN